MAFAGYLKQSTAVDILLGPFLDDTDGKTAETGLTLDVELSKNGQGLANKNDATVPVSDSGGDVDGYYNCELDTTDTNTLGLLTLVAHPTGGLPVRLDFQVVTANWYDSMCSTDLLEVDMQEVDGNDAAAGRMRQWITSWSSGTIQSDSGTTIVLDAGASAVDNFYNGDLIIIHNGTGSEQARTIVDYVGSTKTATLVDAFGTSLDATSDYIILHGGAVDIQAIDGDGTAAANLKSACDNYSATRGLAGTALPDAAADAAGGLPISDDGGLDMDILAALNDISVADIIAGITDGSYDLQEMIRIMAGAMAGKVSGVGTDTITIRNISDTKNVIVATVDGEGNRTATTLDGS